MIPDDKRLQQKNLALGAVLLGLAILLFCLTFIKLMHISPAGQ